MLAGAGVTAPLMAAMKYDRDAVMRYFHEQASEMDARVKAGIEANRKGDVMLLFTDAQGRPCENVHVKVRQTRHDFKYGANLFGLAETKNGAEHAAAYREQTQPELRAKALEAFVRCCYPDNPQPIIEDCQSDCEELRKVAWRALENIRHPEVRGFALNNAAKGLRTPENFALLVTNYTSEDAVMLEELLRELIAAKDWDSVHAAGMDILRLFDKDSKIPRPKHLLPLLYEFTPCSFCRESALVSMSRHRMLTREMLEECQFDCNDDIRSMAAKRLK